MAKSRTPPRGRGRWDGQVAYQALASELRREIADGKFALDHRLPTEEELTQRFEVSRQTVRLAMQDLVAEGLVFRVRGRGTFVTQAGPEGQYVRSVGSIEDLLAFALDTEMEAIAPLGRRVHVEAASRLQLPDDHVVTGTFRRLHDGVPFNVVKVFLPPDIGQRVLERGRIPQLGRRTRINMITVVDETSPLPVMVAQQSITVEPVPADLAVHIDREPGEPVLRIDRLYLDTRGRAIELGISWFHPDRYAYRLTLRRKAPKH